MEADWTTLTVPLFASPQAPALLTTPATPPALVPTTPPTLVSATPPPPSYHQTSYLDL